MSSLTKTKEQNIGAAPAIAQSTQSNGSRRHYQGPRPLLILLSLLALILLLHILAVRNTPSAVMATNCIQLIRTANYTQMVHIQSQAQQMEDVQFADKLIPGQPAAIVQVVSTNAQHTLDVYVYGCTTQKGNPTLTNLFTQRSLLQGTVSISQVNTLVTSQLDPTISGQAATLLQPQQQNIYREYAWNNGTFVQVNFPGLYPVTSRSEAETLQQQANSGQTLPWTDPLATAEQMAKDILKWPTIDSHDAVLSNDGITAHVKLIQQNPSLTVNVTLERLIQPDNKGLWFVVAAQTKDITLDHLAGHPYVSPSQQTQHLSCGNTQSQTQNICSQLATSITSPFMVQGTGTLTDNSMSSSGASAESETTAALFDHTLTPLSSQTNVVLKVNTDGSYTGMLSYTSITPNQPALLLIQSLPPSGSTDAGQLLLVGVILG